MLILSLNAYLCASMSQTISHIYYHLCFTYSDFSFILIKDKEKVGLTAPNSRSIRGYCPPVSLAVGSSIVGGAG
jgi:hypothetical protein